MAEWIAEWIAEWMAVVATVMEAARRKKFFLPIHSLARSQGQVVISRNAFVIFTFL